MRSEGHGSVGLGFSTKVLPAAIATGNIHIGTITGKLNGVMPATTPSGWRRVQLSMPVETWSVKSPLSSCGMPQANSTMSMPRLTSPWASVKTLPCSAVIRWASSSLCLLSSSRNLNITRARRIGGVSAQAGKAAWAAATAASTSARLASATLPVAVPVAGLKTSWVREDRGAAMRPPTKWWIGVLLICMAFSCRRRRRGGKKIGIGGHRAQPPIVAKRRGLRETPTRGGGNPELGRGRTRLRCCVLPFALRLPPPSCRPIRRCPPKRKKRRARSRALTNASRRAGAGPSPAAAGPCWRCRRCRPGPRCRTVSRASRPSRAGPGTCGRSSSSTTSAPSCCGTTGARPGRRGSKWIRSTRRCWTRSRSTPAARRSNPR